MIITKYQNNITTYRGFGTYNTPMKDINTWAALPMPWDKPFNVDDVMNPQPADWLKAENIRVVEMKGIKN